MRTVLPTTLAVSVLGILAAAPVPAASGKPDRTLNCMRNAAPYCNVSCVTVDGKALFVYDQVVSLYITEFAAEHTMLEIARNGQANIISVMVGQISHCTFDGLQDPNLHTG